ncbi:MAG: family 16 glycoside hydrolase [Luteolibacter sp.]
MMSWKTHEGQGTGGPRFAAVAGAMLILGGSLSSCEKKESPNSPPSVTQTASVAIDASPAPGWAVMEALKPGHWEPIRSAAEVEWDDGSQLLRIGVGYYLNGVRWTGPLPTVPYEVELETQRVSGSDFFCGLTFPARSETECVSLIVGGWGGSLVGISSIDGLDASENSTASQMDFEDKRWYRIRVKVGKERLQAWIDDRQVVDVETTGKRLSLREGPIEECAPFGVATWETNAEVRGVRWRKLEN